MSSRVVVRSFWRINRCLKRKNRVLVLSLKSKASFTSPQHSFQKKSAAFQTCKTTFYRPHTFKLKSISKYQLLLHWKSFENIWSFILYLEAGETQLINTCVSTVRDSRIRSEMSWSSIHTKIWTLKQLYHCTQRLNHEDI